VVSVAYFDTSGLLKRYVVEVGSAWVATLLAPPQAPTVLTSRLTIVEASCAFARKHREGALSATDHAAVLVAFDYDVTYRYSLLNAAPDTINFARALAHRHPLRAYDAIHLATAILANQRLVTAGEQPLTFICADTRLIAFAQAEGLATDNPNDHP
jgi:uncharacterized protein